MTFDFTHFAFVSGVLAPGLYGRTDLEKYSLGMKQGHNWFVDYRGGVSVRPPLEYIDEIPFTSTAFIPFQFNLSEGNSTVIILAPGRFYFMQNRMLQSYTIQSVTGSSPYTAPNHGMQVDDLVKTDLGNYLVKSATTNTFILKTLKGADTAPVIDRISHVYSIPHPYTASEIHFVVYEQDRDELYLTHPNHPPAKLVRAPGPTSSCPPTATKRPTAPNIAPFITPSGTGTALTFYAYTKVDLDGKESASSPIGRSPNMVNFTLEQGFVRLSVSPSPNIAYYRFYRSTVFPTTEGVSAGQTLGYIGQSRSPQFTDNNIVPDFTRSPPIARDPFVSGRVQHINVQNSGTGYFIVGNEVTINSDTGSGFSGIATAIDGKLQYVQILEEGKGYLPGDTISVANGTGAVLNLKLSEQSGLFPAATRKFQQRRYYLGTTAAPTRVYASRVGAQSDFDLSDRQTPDEPFELDINSPVLEPIRYALESQLGLLVFTEKEISMIRGANDAVVTGTTNALAPVSQEGIAKIMPLAQTNTILYVTRNSTSIKALSPGQRTTGYSVDDLSIYSSHFFASDNPIVAWCTLESPNRLIFATRRDGTCLFFTYVPEQNVYAWTDGSTNGTMRAAASINENGVDVAYVSIERNGRLFLEQLRPRVVKSVEDLGAADSYLQSTLVYPAGGASILNQIVTTTTYTFTQADIGKHLRLAGGLFTVVGLVTSNQALLETSIEPNEHKPQQPGAIPDAVQGEWSLTLPVKTFFGLRHLEGRTVQVFADGNEVEEQIVKNGSITLPHAASNIIAGLQYNATFQTLPISSDDTIENKRRRLIYAGIRQQNLRGLYAGTPGQPLYEMKERTTEHIGEPLRLQNGIQTLALASAWLTEQSLIVEKRRPILATIIGVTLTMDIGDDEG